MKSKEIARQRPLFADWPTWQKQPMEVRQEVEKLLANMYLEIVKPSPEIHEQERSDESD